MGEVIKAIASWAVETARFVNERQKKELRRHAIETGEFDPSEVGDFTDMELPTHYNHNHNHNHNHPDEENPDSTSIPVSASTSASRGATDAQWIDTLEDAIRKDAYLLISEASFHRYIYHFGVPRSALNFIPTVKEMTLTLHLKPRTSHQKRIWIPFSSAHELTEARAFYMITCRVQKVNNSVGQPASNIYLGRQVIGSYYDGKEEDDGDDRMKENIIDSGLCCLQRQGEFIDPLLFTIASPHFMNIVCSPTQSIDDIVNPHIRKHVNGDVYLPINIMTCYLLIKFSQECYVASNAINMMDILTRHDSNEYRIPSAIWKEFKVYTERTATPGTSSDWGLIAERYDGFPYDLSHDVSFLIDVRFVTV